MADNNHSQQSASGAARGKEQLVFYTTVGCHLCEQAQAIYTAVLNPAFFTVEVVDIADDDALVERYGTRIPVILQKATGRELGWPFDPMKLVDFLGGDQE